MTIDYKFIVGVVVGVIVFIQTVGIIKLLIARYFDLKISVSKRSEIKVHDGSRMKSVSFDSYNRDAENVVRLFKNSDYVDEEKRKS